MSKISFKIFTSVSFKDLIVIDMVQVLLLQFVKLVFTVLVMQLLPRKLNVPQGIIVKRIVVPLSHAR